MSDEHRDQAPQDAPRIPGHNKTEPPPKALNVAPKQYKITKEEVSKSILKKELAVRFKVQKRVKNFYTKLNYKLIESLCTELAKGHYPRTACRIVGIAPNTLTKWLAQGKEDTLKFEALQDAGVKLTQTNITIHHVLFSSVEKALHMAEDRDLACIDFAAQIGIWQAAAWKLERRHTGHWEKKMKLTTDNNVNVNGAVQVQHIIITPDQAPNLEEWKRQRDERAKAVLSQTIDQTGAPIPVNMPGIQEAQPQGFNGIMD